MTNEDKKFAELLAGNKYPPCLNKLIPAEREQFQTALDATLKTWNIAAPALLDSGLRMLAVAELSDRSDVVRIFLDEFITKTVEVNSHLEKRIFGAETHASLQALKDSVRDITETTKRYQKGLPDGYCKVLLALTSDTFILTMRALETNYTANANIIKHATKLSKLEQREILDEYALRSRDSWKGLVNTARERMNSPIMPYMTNVCRHEAKTFDWMRREGMEVKPALDMATAAGQKYVTQFSLTAWFKDEEH